MLDLNPYTYDSVEYCEYEMETAKRNLAFVVSGAGQQIRHCYLNEEQDIVISACEAVIVANEEYQSLKKRYEEAKQKKENNG